MALNEKTHAKLTLGTFISLIIFIIAGTWAVAVYMGNLKLNVTTNRQSIIILHEDYEYIRASVKENGKSIQFQEVKQAEINTKLANIENRQIEMIKILKELY